MNEWIRIENAVLRGNRVENEIALSKGLVKYFKYNAFYAEYDEELQWIPSILNIPAVSCLITLAWLTGATLYVEELDYAFVESMKLLRREYDKMYPEVLSGNLWVKTVHKNKSNVSGLALFFSGGLDSTYSLYQLRESSPRLIMVGGFDFYMDNSQDELIWKKWKETYGEFAEKEELKINFIRTNSRACVIESLVNGEYRNKLKLTFWDAIRHAPLLIGLAAPLSIGRFDELVIAASRTYEHPTTMLPYSSAPNTDEKIAWATLRVIHHGRIHRYEKVRGLLEPLRDGRITLNTCYKPIPEFNCSECEKCGKVITFLLAEGIDPNTCGFEVDENTLGKIKREFEKYLKWNYRMQLHWVPWKNDLPDEVPNLYGIKEFVEWIRGTDI